MIQSIASDQKFLYVNWSNSRTSTLPFIYLRDNCPANRHANGQKLTETASLDMAIRPTKAELSGNETVDILWTDGHQSKFTSGWILAHDLSDAALTERKTMERTAAPSTLWDERMNESLPECDYAGISTDNKTLAVWLGYVQEYGFAVLRDVPPVEGTVLEVVKRFGYVRETNYGKLFDVKNVINPTNLAFTGLGISPHTDNPYRNPTPTLQLLHCLSSSATGGDSVLVDGFKVASDLRLRHPALFDSLSSVMVSFKYQDSGNWLERKAPIIQLHPDGTIASVKFNNRSVQPFQLSPTTMLQFYEAYMYFSKMIDAPCYQVRFKMSAGDLYIVDNERVMHARSGYDNTGGERWLQGAYADRDGLQSKWRTLRETFQQTASPITV